jgi:hypothetical protein
MGKNYLYWLGAGASANALPLVASFENVLREFKDKLAFITINKSVPGQKQVRDEFIFKIDWMLENLAVHASVDTFAKKLYFKRDTQNLKVLKAILSCFFVAEQSTKRVDYRYDSFFASILKFDGLSSVQIPDDIKFLLWNYDLQIEKAYFGYVDDENKVIKDLTFSKSLYHLNGYCGTTKPGLIGKEFKEAFQIKPEISNLILELYSDYCQGAISDINFAWEMNENYFNNSINPVTESIREVIIIGYSFPFFNREVDKQIFQRLKDVEKIYVQSPQESMTGIKERILAISPNLPKIIPIEDTSQFYIPFDYNL